VKQLLSENSCAQYNLVFTLRGYIEGTLSLHTAEFEQLEHLSGLLSVGWLVGCFIICKVFGINFITDVSLKIPLGK